MKRVKVEENKNNKSGTDDTQASEQTWKEMNDTKNAMIFVMLGIVIICIANFGTKKLEEIS